MPFNIMTYKFQKNFKKLHCFSRIFNDYNKWSLIGNKYKNIFTIRLENSLQLSKHLIWGLVMSSFLQISSKCSLFIFHLLVILSNSLIFLQITWNAYVFKMTYLKKMISFRKPSARKIPCLNIDLNLVLLRCNDKMIFLCWWN